MQRRRHSLDIQFPALGDEAGRDHSWPFMLTVKPHFLL
jgi:hypothetical protein